MPLNRNNLITEIRKINDESFDDFEGFPETIESTATRWANLVDNYAGANLIPVVNPIFLESARIAFFNQFLLLSNKTQNGIQVFANAFAAYAVQIALGMQPVFTGLVPPTRLSIESIIPVGLNGGSAQVIASLLATLIDTWFRTGTAINNQTGATVNWN